MSSWRPPAARSRNGLVGARGFEPPTLLPKRTGSVAHVSARSTSATEEHEMATTKSDPQQQVARAVYVMRMAAEQLRSIDGHVETEFRYWADALDAQADALLEVDVAVCE